MRKNRVRIMMCFIISLGLGCATVPPESVTVSRQLEKNLSILRQNNILLLDEWYKLSVDYWTEKVAQEGPDKILEKAKEQGISIDLTTDYRDLVQQVFQEYRKNFLEELNGSYQSYRDGINEDYFLTIDGAQKLTNLLQSVVKADAARAALVESVSSKLKIRDGIENIQSQLQSAIGP